MKKLNILSSTDMLTGIMNRNEMNNCVDAMANSNSGKSVGVIFADLNGLKSVNDTLGHNAGDQLLKDAAKALREVFEVHEIFRAGGDEFVVLLTDVTREELLEKVDKLKIAEGHYKNLSFAIGTSFDSNVKNVRLALHNADEKMYTDKKHYYELHPERKRSIIDKRHDIQSD